ncbi:MAG: hypothetical protein HY369_03925 [Candidatus Aenigmarchaeota archaeon]|nr:hypothetical protein [Candidatus Aenigmarchaeota archaeon]
MTTFRCPVCGLHYPDATLAEKCAAWCRTHQSCNLAITRHAVASSESS